MPPPLDAPLPTSSIPALTAAKCAERQGDAAFARFHDRLFTALFRDGLDIARPDVLRGLAREVALDVARFEADYARRGVREPCCSDCAEGAAWFGVSGLPTVILNEKLSLVGAVPIGALSPADRLDPGRRAGRRHSAGARRRSAGQSLVEAPRA